MKSREQKQKDLEALTEQLNNAKSAVVVSFTNLTVNKDQEVRNQLREAGAKYQVVKNTLARLAVKGTPYEEATEHFKGVTAIAWTDDEPVDLSKAVSKFIKENSSIFTFKTGIVEGEVVDFDKIKEIASLPSKEELIGKLLFLLNAPAQRLATVLSAVPRDLAIVLKQVSEGEGEIKAGENKETESAEVKEEAVEEKSEEAKAEETVEEKTTEEPQQEESKETAEAEEAEAPAQETEEKVEAVEEEPKQEESESNPEASAEEESAEDAEKEDKAE